MTRTNCHLFTHKSSRSYLNHLVHSGLLLCNFILPVRELRNRLNMNYTVNRNTSQFHPSNITSVSYRKDHRPTEVIENYRLCPARTNIKKNSVLCTTNVRTVEQMYQTTRRYISNNRNLHSHSSKDFKISNTKTKLGKERFETEISQPLAITRMRFTKRTPKRRILFGQSRLF